MVTVGQQTLSSQIVDVLQGRVASRSELIQPAVIVFHQGQCEKHPIKSILGRKESFIL